MTFDEWIAALRQAAADGGTQSSLAGVQASAGNLANLYTQAPVTMSQFAAGTPTGTPELMAARIADAVRARVAQQAANPGQNPYTDSWWLETQQLAMDKGISMEAAFKVRTGTDPNFAIPAVAASTAGDTTMGPPTSQSTQTLPTETQTAPTAAEDPAVTELRNLQAQGVELQDWERQLIANADAQKATQQANVGNAPSTGPQDIGAEIAGLWPGSPTVNQNNSSGPVSTAGGGSTSWDTGNNSNDDLYNALTGGQNMATAPWGTPQIEDTFDESTSYLNRLGLGNRNYWNPSEQYAVSQYKPLQTMWGLQQRMGAVNPTYAPSSGYFADYVAPYQNQNIYGGARFLLNNILSATPEQRAQWGATYDPIYENGELTSRNGLDELSQLMQTALRPTLGRQGASFLTGRLPQEQQMWASSQATGQQTGSFLDYLMSKYNLGVR